jgi:hypothetical protein
MLLVIPIVISGGDGAAAGLLIYFIGAPRYVNWRVRVNSWKADDELTRERAWMIRNRLRDRIGEPMVELEDRPWVEYVNDVVRCRRDEAYELLTKVSD